MCTLSLRSDKIRLCSQDQELLPPALQFLPSTKTREPDHVLRLTHVETLLLLCATHWGREHLRHNGVYQIVRALHENEQVDQVNNLVYVFFLLPNYKSLIRT